MGRPRNKLKIVSDLEKVILDLKLSLEDQENKISVYQSDFLELKKTDPKSTSMQSVIMKGNIKNATKKANEIKSQIIEEEEKIEHELAVALQKQKERIQFADLTSTNKPKSTIDNALMIYEKYGITAKYNEMTRRSNLDISGTTYVSDYKNDYVKALIENYYNLHEVPLRSMNTHLNAISLDNAFHPVKNWVDSIVWDGKSRLDDFYDTLILNQESHGSPEYIKLAHTLMRKWAISAVAALYNEEPYIEGVLCFQGKQGLGKSRWIHELMPDIGHDWIGDGVILNTKDKDSVLRAISVWISELSELDATFKKNDLSDLKSFLTTKTDDIRQPYGRESMRMKRRTVFVASINDHQFLQDDQNRRFWTVAVDDIKIPNFDVSQFWAEIKHLYDILPKSNHNSSWILTKDEVQLLSEMQAPHKSLDPTIQILESQVLPAKSIKNGEWVNCTVLLQKCGISNITKHHANMTCKWLKANGYRYRTSNKQFFVELGNLNYEENSRPGTAKIFQLPKKD